MSRKLPKILAALLVMVMSFSLLSACGDNTDNRANTPTVDATDTPSTTVTPSTTDPVEDTTEPAIVETSTGDTPLVAAFGTFNEKFTPFFSNTDYDTSVYEMTAIGLMVLDRAGNIVYNAIDGETRNYNGVDYFYDGVADLSAEYDADTNITTYRAKLREDLKFSDGMPVTADDLIFTYYVYLDPSYTGSATMYSYDILGLRNYRTQLSDEALATYGPIVDAMIAAGPTHEWTSADAWSQETHEAFWAEIKAAWLDGCQQIVDYCAANYAETYGEAYFGHTAEEINASAGMQTAFGMIMWGFGDFNDDGLFYGAVTGNTWTLEGDDAPTIEDYYNETFEAYEGDADEFWIVEDPAGKEIGLAQNLQGKYIQELSAAAGEVSGVANIAGIRKLNQYEVEVLVEGYSATAIYSILGITINPLHYYGDPAQYDYENNQFGFPFGDLELVHSKDTKPLGAGPYNFVKFENKVVYFEANPLYWKGEPATKYVQFKEAPNSEFVSGIISGTHDQGNVSGSIGDRDYIKDNNSNGELTGDTITTSMVDNLGYGYIGINSLNVSVDGERGSEASKNLRKALATVLAVYRDTAINSYYGELANAIQYPISNTNWAAPQPTDEGFEIAFAKDIAGNAIYTNSMSQEEKYQAAREAALGFLEAAGYTIQDGKAVAGPSDVRKTNAGDMSYLEFEVWIPAEGQGDHPAFALLTDFSESMAQIGINIVINDVANSSDMFSAMDAEVLDMWTAAWAATVDPDMYQVYHGENIIGVPGSPESNKYGICDAELDELIMAARLSDDQAYRKAVYKQAFDRVMDWAVEVPNYQRKNFEIFSTERINVDTLTPMITTNWGWRNDIELIEMK